MNKVDSSVNIYPFFPLPLEIVCSRGKNKSCAEYTPLHPSGSGNLSYWMSNRARSTWYADSQCKR